MTAGRRILAATVAFMSRLPTGEVLLYGAGGHALVCLEVLRQDPSIEVVFAITDTGSGRSDLGLEVRAASAVLQKLTQSDQSATFCVAIGANAARQRIVKNLTESGHLLTLAVSRSATVSPSAQLGDGVQILPGAVVMAAVRLGDGVIVNTNASVDHDGVIGDYVHIAPGVAIAGDVTIGARTLVGIGARVLPGVRIGSDAVIGGGAVVVEDVVDGVTVAGNPARPLRRDPR